MEQQGKVSQGMHGFCTNCGSPLEEGVSFCTNCGNPVERTSADSNALDSRGVEADSVDSAAVSEQETVVLDVEPDLAREAQGDREAAMQATEALYGVENVESAFAPNESATYAQATDSVSSGQQTSTVSKKPLFIGLGIAAVLLVIVVVLAVLVFGKAGSVSVSDEDVAQDSASAVQQPEATQDPAEQKEEEESSEPVVVNLTDAYTTRFADVNSITYPAFTFQYPGTEWAITGESVAPSGEYVDIENLRNGTVVSYQHWGSYPSSSAVAELVDVERVADSAFVPSYVQGTDHSDLGPFGVMRGTLRIDGVDNGTVYAVLPDAALKNPAFMDMSSGLPSFEYSSQISFTCMTTEKLDRQTEQEVVAILASFKVAEASDSASDSKKSSLSDPDGYVLPGSASQTYSNAELEEMSDYELYLARNEIFARHGRIFNNSDLKEYFGSKSWYEPRYAPEEFSDSMLNANEKANVERMAKIEQDRNSPYVD